MKRSDETKRRDKDSDRQGRGGIKWNEIDEKGDQDKDNNSNNITNNTNNTNNTSNNTNISNDIDSSSGSDTERGGKYSEIGFWDECVFVFISVPEKFADLTEKNEKKAERVKTPKTEKNRERKEGSVGGSSSSLSFVCGVAAKMEEE